MPIFTTFSEKLVTVSRRVVSLVPSITDSLIQFGFSSRVQGISDFCPWIESTTEPLRVGGTKDPDVKQILALKPELILADREENSASIIQELDSRGAAIWLTFSRTVADVLDMLAELVCVFQGGEAALARLRLFETSSSWARLASEHERRIPYFCPIWREHHSREGLWWMTFNGDTYASDLLTLCGGDNCFRERLRAYPLEADLKEEAGEDAGERDRSYPRVTPAEICKVEPELILIPDEPYSFSEDEIQELANELAETPAVQSGRILRIDGRDLTWNGARAIQTLANLPAVFQS